MAVGLVVPTEYRPTLAALFTLSLCTFVVLWFRFIRPLRQDGRAIPGEPENLTVDDRGVRRQMRGGRNEEIEWKHLTKVMIVTTDDGPACEDFFFVLVDAGDRGCAVPNGAAASAELLRRLQRIPGFDNKAVCDATTFVERNQFVCWEGRPGEAAAAGETADGGEDDHGQ
ncbi:MAG: hypothetical protein HY897_21955 [Deltaproteobacteria bacterium]|nr:hypothetical protein [Deltaproteobacteria bacterium]